MAVWLAHENGPDRFAAQRGFVAMYLRTAALDEAAGWMRDHGYRVAEIDTAQWATPEDVHRELANALDFPDYYGNNWDALADAFNDVSEGHYGWSTADTGLVLVLHNYDSFAADDPDGAHLLLDIFSTSAHLASLVGNRMLCLIGSNDAHLSIDPVGAHALEWVPGN